MPALLAAEAGLAGLGLCCYGIYHLSLRDRLRARRAVAAEAAHPDAPWRANPAWAKGEVTSSSFGAAAFLWFFALNWWGMLLFAVTDRGEALLAAPWPEQALMAVFPLIGLVTVWTAVKRTLHWRRYGTSTLTIETLPGRPGGRFDATVRTGIATKPKRSYRVRLTGQERVWSRAKNEAGDIAQRRGDVRDAAPFAEATASIPPSKMKIEEGGLALRVSLPIPADARSSGPAGEGREIVWTLALESTGKADPAFAAVFEVPVFR